MERERLKPILENLLFVADSPVPLDQIGGVLKEIATVDEVADALHELKADFEKRAIQLVEVAEGWRFMTRPEYAEWITAFFKMEKGQRLGRAALEALAIIAYRQPITRAEVDEIRGVDSGAALRGLIDKGLVKTMGRRKTPGRPMMYGTTKRFLEYFGLARLADLPTMDEFAQELAEGLPGADDSQESIDFDYQEGAPPPAEDLDGEPGDETGDEPIGRNADDDADDEYGDEEAPDRADIDEPGEAPADELDEVGEGIDDDEDLETGREE